MEDKGKISIGKNIKDSLYEYLQNPIKENFSDLMGNETGEYDYIDFKTEWISNEQLIKEILGISNSGGGVIIFGIREDESGCYSVGLEKFKDKADISKGIQHYLPSTIKYEVHNFNYDETEYKKLSGRKYQVLSVEYDPVNLPYTSEKSTGKIQSGMIFIRRGTNISLANYDEVQELLNRKISATYSMQSNLELKAHINQLETLYSNISKTKLTAPSGIITALKQFSGLLGNSIVEMNEKYPEEDFEDFIVKMIKLKKMKIEKVLDLK